MRSYHKTGNRPGRPAYRTPSSFRGKVFKVVSEIPRGKVLSYKDVAKRSGYPRAWRAVGNVLKKNYNSAIPCHRVVRSNGEAGKYNRGSRLKIKKLKREGVL